MKSTDNENKGQIAKTIIQRIILLLLAAYITLLFFPYLVFNESMQLNQVRIYSRSPLPKGTKQFLQKCSIKMSTLKTFSETGIYNIYICNNEFLFNIFIPFRKKAYAGTIISNAIVVASADIQKETINTFSERYGQRTLEPAITHELIHVYLRRCFGYVNMLTSPQWIKEGYCDYISGNHTMDKAKGYKLIKEEGLNYSEPEYRFFIWKEMVKYLIEEKNISIKELIDNPPNELKIFHSLQQHILAEHPSTK